MRPRREKLNGGRFLPMPAAALMISIIGLVLTVPFAEVTPAQERAGTTEQSSQATADRDGPSAALSALQEAQTRGDDAFVVQGELDCLIREGGGGGCASAAGIDLLQALRLMAGLEPLGSPHKVVLSSFADQPALLDGRVTNDQMVRLFRFYEPHLDGVKVAVEVTSAPNSDYWTSGPRWSASEGPDLRVEPRQIRILAYTVTDDGERLGRHFVLLKERTADEVVAVDPSSPAKDRRYQVAYRKGVKGARERIFLLPPPRFAVPGMVFEMNTVFTVSLANGEPQSAGEETRPVGVKPESNGAASVEDIKAGIDRTAEELRGTDEWLSPRAWRKKTASFGLPGLDLPVEHGGLGWAATKMVEVFRHAGRHNLNFRDIVGGAHVRPLLTAKNPAVHEIVRQIARGDGYVAIAITEPEAGTDVRNIRSIARKVEGGYRISGQKRFNARLEQATHVVVFTQSATGKHGDLTAFVLPIDTPGLEVETLEAHGLTGNSYGGLSFDDMFVSDGQLIGEDGKGSDLFDEHFLYWRLMQSAAAIGTGERALEMMAERIKTRQVHGGPIGRFTHLQQPIGQHTTELRMAFALAKEAAAMIDRGQYREARGIVCGIKAEGVEIALNAVDAATRAYGGEGYSTRVDLGDRLRDLNGLRIADGTTDVMRMEVVRQIYGREFWDMAVRNTTGAATGTREGGRSESTPSEGREDSIDGAAIERIEERLNEGGANDSFPPYTEPPVEIQSQPVERP